MLSQSFTSIKSTLSIKVQPSTPSPFFYLQSFRATQASSPSWRNAKPSNTDSQSLPILDMWWGSQAFKIHLESQVQGWGLPTPIMILELFSSASFYIYLTFTLAVFDWNIWVECRSYQPPYHDTRVIFFKLLHLSYFTFAVFDRNIWVEFRIVHC